MDLYKDLVPKSSGAISICHTPVHWLEVSDSDQPVPWGYPHSTTFPLSPPTTTALENATNFCHLLRDVEEDQALLKRGRPAGNPYWHPQAGSTPHIPAWGKGQTPQPALAGTTTHPRQPNSPGGGRPMSSTYREICEGYTCGEERTMIRPLDRDALVSMPP